MEHNDVEVPRKTTSKSDPLFAGKKTKQIKTTSKSERNILHL